MFGGKKQSVGSVMRVYSLRDKVADEHGDLFTAKNDEVAMRNLQLMAKKNPMVNPSDFELYYHGTWNPEHGTLTSGSPKLVTALMFKNVLEEKKNA